MAMASTCGIQLRLASGVPVVEVQGLWEPSSAGQLVEMIGALASAGHFEIIVNLQRAATRGAAVLQSLWSVADAVRSRHGHIDIVGTADQVEHLAARAADDRFRLYTSEASALRRIKRVPVYIPGPTVTARPATSYRTP
ncbi:MAG TPA: hypothetical protein VLH79_08870 [Chthonomonadales bacterium]|nr:hypothetical protein [Chthonomonadales bacterium]